MVLAPQRITGLVTRRGWRLRAARPLLALAADAGACPALGGQDAAVAGVSVAPAQIVLELPASTVWLGWSQPPITKERSGPNCASIGLAHEAFVGVKHSSVQKGEARGCSKGLQEPGADHAVIHR